MKKFFLISLKINKTIDENIIEAGNKIPFSLNKKLLKRAFIYCKIDVWPNLMCIFAIPNMILSSFKILVYGRWYKLASGLLIVSNVKIIVDITDINIQLRNVLKNLLFLQITSKPKIKININIMELKLRLRGIKKFANRAKKDRNIEPKIANEYIFLSLSFESKIFPAQFK